MGTDLDICRNRHGGADTSMSAFENTPASTRQKQAQRVLTYIVKHGPCSCEDVELGLQMPHQSASARISELKRNGEITDTGLRVKTRSNHSARLYVATQ